MFTAQSKERINQSLLLKKQPIEVRIGNKTSIIAMKENINKKNQDIIIDKLKAKTNLKVKAFIEKARNNP
jgi:hypothetical protein